LFRVLLAVPAIVLLTRFQMGSGGFGNLIEGSGEWSARLLIAALCVTPLRMIFRGQRWPLWLFKRRRDLGVAAFLYALLHLSAYALRQGSLGLILADFGHLGIILGWTAFACMLVPFAVSNEAALRRLGTSWKPIQRLVYVAAGAVLAHWIWLKANQLSAFIHFIPLLLLEAYRVWHKFTRQSRQPREG
jgi:sulfoxide reductase heme-binding subunit YedZ